MSKYFIEDNVYYKGEKQPPRKTIIEKMIVEPNGHSAICYDSSGSDYTLELSDIYDDEDNPIKDARLKLKMTQKEFAEFIGMPKRTLEDWEIKKSYPKNYILDMIIEKSFAKYEKESKKI